MMSYATAQVTNVPYRLALIVTAALVAFTFVPATTLAAPGETGLSRTIDGMVVHIGLVPSEIVSEHLPTHSESRMHGGKRVKRHSYHLVAALTDTQTGKRITDMQVKARVAPLGLGPEEKKLELMKIDNTTSFGNYFSLPVPGPYRITLFIQRPDSPRITEVRFQYKH